jgi:sugar/nucleoside kinase (ribokinase family)
MRLHPAAIEAHSSGRKGLATTVAFMHRAAALAISRPGRHSWRPDFLVEAESG